MLEEMKPLVFFFLFYAIPLSVSIWVEGGWWHAGHFRVKLELPLTPV